MTDYMDYFDEKQIQIELTYIYRQCSDYLDDADREAFVDEWQTAGLDDDETYPHALDTAKNIAAKWSPMDFDADDTEASVITSMRR